MIASPRLAAAFAAVFLGFGATIAVAQETISRDILTSTSALNQNQQRQVDQYVTRWLGMLAGGNHNEVPRARQKLLEPFAVGPNVIFLNAYSASLANQLAQPLQSDAVIVRLNLMIVVGRMVNAEAVGYVLQGLDDASPAVRYAAARAGAQIGARTEVAPLAPEHQGHLLQAIVNRLEHEYEPLVVDQLLLSLAGMNFPQAANALLEALDRRVNLHAANPDAALAADIEAIVRVYRRLVLATTHDTEFLKDLARVCFRRMDLSARLMQSGQAPEARRGEHRRVLTDCDNVLRWIAGKLADMPVPESITPLVQATSMNHSQIRLRIEEWRRLLIMPPVEIPRDRLAVN